MNYHQIIEQCIRLYQLEMYDEAYEYISDRDFSFEVIESQITNFRYAIAAKSGKLKLGKDIFRQAIIEKNYWYSYQYLMNDEDLIDLRKDDDILKLMELCKDRENKALKDTVAQLSVFEPTTPNLNGPMPLMIALHGNQENSRITKPFYERCLEYDYLLAIPDSSQIVFSDAYSWNDYDLGLEELIEHFKTISKKIPLDLDQVMIGGFSAGARLALYSVLKEAIVVKHCILMAPWLPEIKEWEYLFHNIKLKNTKFHIFIDPEDKDCYEGAIALKKMLSKHLIPHQYLVVKELGHSYHESFSEDLIDIIMDI